MPTDNIIAFLDMIAVSELTQAVIDGSDNGYNVLVGSLPGKILTFDDYSDHPRIFNRDLNSTAAGRYQLLARYFDSYKVSLCLPDFSPEAQDHIAIQQIKECHAFDNVNAGNIHIAIAECSRIWASLPGNSYGQHQNKMQDLCNIFTESGGVIA